MIINYNLYGFIYITTNLINGKRYIGQKKFDDKSRWKSYLGSGYNLIKAIKKYGKENFKRDIVDLAYSSEELNNKEKQWIDNYNAVNSIDFYNLIEGGNVSDILHNNNGKSIICINTGTIFNSITEAISYYNITKHQMKKYIHKYLSNKNTKLIESQLFFIKYEDINKYKNNNIINCSNCGKEFCNYYEGYYLCEECLINKGIKIKCSICGITINKKSSNHKYCEKCSKNKK